MPNEYVLVATKPDGSKVFWTWAGFSKHEHLAGRMISLDFADKTFGMERSAHPDWKFDLRVYEAQSRPQYKQKLGAKMGVIEQIADEFVDEIGPLPTCAKCGLTVGVCECKNSRWEPTAMQQALANEMGIDPSFSEMNPMLWKEIERQSQISSPLTPPLEISCAHKWKSFNSIAICSECGLMLYVPTH